MATVLLTVILGSQITAGASKTLANSIALNQRGFGQSEYIYESLIKIQKFIWLLCVYGRNKLLHAFYFRTK